MLQLVSLYLGKGHHVFPDRFYSSIPLVQTLAEQQIYFTSTIMKNRIDLPDAIRARFTLADDTTMQFQCERLMVIAWRAKSKKSPVIMISSARSAEMTEVQNRKGQCVKKPVAVHTYNSSLNGSTACNDQYCTYYSFLRSTLKWWRKMFFYLLECATVNSYILHKEACLGAGAKPLTSLDFRRSVIEDLVQDHLQQSGSHPLAGRPLVVRGWVPLLSVSTEDCTSSIGAPPTATVWSAADRQGTQLGIIAKLAQNSQHFTPLPVSKKNTKL